MNKMTQSQGTRDDVTGAALGAKRFHEIADGIMSAIDVGMHITRVAPPKGDRVKVETTGKVLACNAW